MLSSHSVLGLAFAAIIYLVCLTGTIAVFAPDLQRLELPRAPVAAQLTPDAAARALGTAAKQVPGDVALNLTLPSPERSGARLIAFKGRFERNWAVAEDGGLTPLEALWTEFLLYLHICLHLRRNWGGFLVGLTGVALLSSLVYGILACCGTRSTFVLADRAGCRKRTCTTGSASGRCPFTSPSRLPA